MRRIILAKQEWYPDFAGVKSSATQMFKPKKRYAAYRSARVSRLDCHARQLSDMEGEVLSVPVRNECTHNN